MLNPAVSAYRFFPEFIRKGVSNFFTNLDNLQTVINEIFQLRPVAASRPPAGSVVNTTSASVVSSMSATPMNSAELRGLRPDTRLVGAVPAGAIPVLPLFGPSFVRDTGGRLVDSRDFQLDRSLQLDDSAARTYTFTLLVLNTRSTTSFQYYQTGSPFEYELVRLLWSTKRKLEIEK
jgi:phospholipid-binding lipoprotein MlaA